MKYLMLIKHAESSSRVEVPQALMDAMGEFVTQGFASGILKDTAGLRPTSAGHRIRLSGGKLQTTDGPFTETKEFLGGFTVVDVADDDAAKMWAGKVAEACGWPQEVRRFKPRRGSL